MPHVWNCLRKQRLTHGIISKNCVIANLEIITKNCTTADLEIISKN